MCNRRNPLLVVDFQQLSMRRIAGKTRLERTEQGSTIATLRLEVLMDELIERQREIVTRHIRGENEGDWKAVYETFVQDDSAYYDVVPLSARFKGIEGVRGFYQSIAAALPDLHVEVISEYDVPGCSIREVVITGTHEGEFAGIKPKGNPIRIEMASFYVFDSTSTSLVAERIYYDQASAIAQMEGKQVSAVA